MGYSHSWKNYVVIDNETWLKIIEDCKTVLDYLIADDLKLEGYEGPSELVDLGCIWLNGAEPNSCETFVLTQEEEEFASCKTNRKPYDLAVQCCLLIVSYHHSEFKYRSDGSREEWLNAIDIVNLLFKYDVSFNPGFC